MTLEDLEKEFQDILNEHDDARNIAALDGEQEELRMTEHIVIKRLLQAFIQFCEDNGIYKVDEGSFQSISEVLGEATQ